MTWFATSIGQSGGGGNSFTKTMIMDNSALESTLAFTSDYHNYDLLEFVTLNTYVANNVGVHRFLTSPEIIDAILQYSSNQITLNEFNSNQYSCYSKTSDTVFTQGGNRNLACVAVYGIKYSGTVSKTAFYSRQSLGSSDVTVTSSDSFFDYDIILFSTCTTLADETILCANTVYKDELYTLKLNKYDSYRMVTVSENSITAYQYFYVQGIKFS